MSVRELLKVHGQPEKEVYFDVENSGFVPKEVVDVMLPYFNRTGYGNPAITHKPGWEAYEVFYETKELVAKTINAKPEEIIFTHSGTEANNLALTGFVIARKKALLKVHAMNFESVRTLSVAVLNLFLIPFIDLSDISLKVYAIVYFVSLLSTIGILLMAKALRHNDISLIYPLRNIKPIFVLLLAYIFLHERIALKQFFGVMITVSYTHLTLPTTERV